MHRALTSLTHGTVTAPRALPGTEQPSSAHARTEVTKQGEPAAMPRDIFASQQPAVAAAALPAKDAFPCYRFLSLPGCATQAYPCPLSPW